MDNGEQKLLRNRTTLYLLLGAAASLLIPLLGVLYLRFIDDAAPASGNSVNAFARRDGQVERIRAAAAPAPAAPRPPNGKPTVTAETATDSSGRPQAPASDSLGFIRGGSDYYQQAQARPPAEPAPAPAAAPAEPPTPPRKPAKPSARTFAQPKLNSTGARGSFYNFGGKQPFAGGSGGLTQHNQAPGTPPSGVPDVGAMLKSVPGAGSGAPAGMPDVGDMLKSVPGYSDPGQK
ncbi:MAG: hypothetical protein PHF00_04460 [Elusimicrobia bacterium]|nr:hypothetical protein [Elusimicrobiota bacterium]